MVKDVWKRMLPLQIKTALEICHCPLLFFFRPVAKWPPLKQLVKLNDQIYKAVPTLPPTFVEAERASSATGLFVTKMRSSLSDNSIDSLCFLHHHFLKSNWKKFQQDDSLWNSLVHHYVIFCFPLIFRVCFRCWFGSSRAHWSLEDFSYF